VEQRRSFALKKDDLQAGKKVELGSDGAAKTQAPKKLLVVPRKKNARNTRPARGQKDEASISRRKCRTTRRALKKKEGELS